MTTKKTNLTEATLCFLKDGTKVCLAMKKRGFGEGKWNGIGGKLEKGETPREAIKRETMEEISVSLAVYKRKGVIDFFGLGHDQRVYIYVSNKWSGQPQESEEMRPKWFDIKEIPYNLMWPDIQIWLPLILKGAKLEAEFHFDSKGKITQKNIKEY